MLSRLQVRQGSWAHGCRQASANRLHVIAAASAKVSVKISKHVEFGESVAIVGSIAELGAWEPTTALPLTWAEPDLWHLDIDLPAGQGFEYKYIIQKGSADEVEWQAGDNLTISLSEATTAAAVVDSWEGGHATVEMTPPGEDAIVVATEQDPSVAAMADPGAVEEQSAASAVWSQDAAPTSGKPTSNILPGPLTKTAGKAVASEEAEVAV